MQVKQNLEHKFPHLEVVGTNYPPGKTKVRAPCWSNPILPTGPTKCPFVRLTLTSSCAPSATVSR